jgi:hypothetical protein
MFFSDPLFLWNFFLLVVGGSDLVLELFAGCANIFNRAFPDYCEEDIQKEWKSWQYFTFHSKEEEKVKNEEN